MRRLTDLSNTWVDNFNYTTGIFVTPLTNRLILIGRKNFHSSTAACSVICFDLDGNVIYNKAYQGNPVSMYLNCSYSSACQVIGDKEYIVIALRLYGNTTTNKIGYMVVDASSGYVLTCKYTNLVSDSDQVYKILFTDHANPTQFSMFTLRGHFLKTDWNSTGNSIISKKANILLNSASDCLLHNSSIYMLLFSNTYKYLVKTDLNFNIQWCKSLPSFIINARFAIYDSSLYLFLNDNGVFYACKCDVTSGDLESVVRCTNNLMRVEIVNDWLVIFAGDASNILIVRYKLDWFFKTRYFHFPRPYQGYYFKRIRDYSRLELTNASLPSISNETVTYSNTSVSEATPYTVSNVNINSLPYEKMYGKKIYI